MTTYLMFGKYSLEGVKAISAKRTSKAMAIIKQNGGKYKGGFVMLGNPDLVVIVDLPDMKSAVKVSTALSKQMGISFRTSPAFSIEDFDKIIK